MAVPAGSPTQCGHKPLRCTNSFKHTPHLQWSHINASAFYNFIQFTSADCIMKLEQTINKQQNNVSLQGMQCIHEIIHNVQS